ncbi:50S ribosomal protein L7/L12 [Striga asiatica]|uniref:Large ribosomal subunit protein bL12c n=1 Tax=Striga asiatica TaxID=4170 RepID=A0A5A7R7Q4_STRAF|nr:50S ribosomal protein L7/L12 [Striga asiatica]
MSSLIFKMPSNSLVRTLLRRTLCTATETRTQKLERIADVLLDLNKFERHDYVVLLSYKMGFNRYGPAATAPGPQSASSAAAGASTAAAAAKEKTAFDVKLEKFESSAKLKVIKEIRSFTDLGLKEAKDLVEKTPAVVKKGVTKEEAEKIVQKLKEVGATVINALLSESEPDIQAAANMRMVSLVHIF